MEELFANIIFMSTIVATISSIVGVIFGVISIKTDNAFVNICFNIFINIGAILFCGISVAVLVLIIINFFPKIIKEWKSYMEMK